MFKVFSGWIFLLLLLKTFDSSANTLPELTHKIIAIESNVFNSMLLTIDPPLEHDNQKCLNEKAIFLFNYDDHEAMYELILNAFLKEKPVVFRLGKCTRYFEDKIYYPSIRSVKILAN